MGTCCACLRRYHVLPDGHVRHHFAFPFVVSAEVCPGGGQPPSLTPRVVHLISHAAAGSPTLCCGTVPAALPVFDTFACDRNKATCAGPSRPTA
jgi:hypothetical protein